MWIFSSGPPGSSASSPTPTGLVAYRLDIGIRYLDHQPVTPPNRLVPEDLAVTIVINSNVKGVAFTSVQDHGAALDLARLPDKPLELTTDGEREVLAEFIADVAARPGFGASVATKPSPALRTWVLFDRSAPANPLA